MMPSTVLVMNDPATRPASENGAERYPSSGSSRQFQRDSVMAVPNAAVGEIKQRGEADEEDHDIEAGALALFHLGLGRPGEERDHVARFLIDGVRRAVGVSDRAVR